GLVYRQQTTRIQRPAQWRISLGRPDGQTAQCPLGGRGWRSGARLLSRRQTPGGAVGQRPNVACVGPGQGQGGARPPPALQRQGPCSRLVGGVLLQQQAPRLRGSGRDPLRVGGCHGKAHSLDPAGHPPNPDGGVPVQGQGAGRLWRCRSGVARRCYIQGDQTRPDRWRGAACHLSRRKTGGPWKCGPGRRPPGAVRPGSGKKLPPFKGSDPGHSLAFLPDSKHLVVTHAGSPGESLRLWDVAARKEVRRFQGLEPGLHPGSFLLAVSPDGRKAAAGAIGHNGLQRRDIATGKLLSPTGRLAGFPTYMAVSPDGKAIASLDHGAWDHVKLWNATTGERLQPLLTTPLGGYGLTYSPDGKMLLVAQPSRPTWRALDTATGKFRGEFEGQSIAFSPDGKWLAAAWHKLDKLQRQSDAAVRLLDAATGKPIREMEKLNGVESKNTGVEALAFSADGKTLLAVVKGKEARWVRVWDSATGKALRDSTLFPREWAQDLIPTVRGIAPDGSVLAVSSPVRDTYTHKVVLCDLASGRVIRSFTAQIHVASCQMVFSPDARIVAVVQGGAVCLHESAS